MARALQRYKKLFEALKKGEPRPLYLLYGPEEYIKKEFVGEILKRALPEENRAFNLDIVQGDDFDRARFHDRVSAFPLFSDRRVIIVKAFEALSTTDKDFVIERLAAIPAGLVAIIETSADKLDTARLKKLDKLAREAGVSCRFEHLSDLETVERIRARLRRAGVTAEPAAIDLLVESVGTNLADLINEADKLVLAAGDGGTVSERLVVEVVGKYRTEGVFGFLDELGKGDVSLLVRRMNRVIDSGEEPVFILALLLRRVVQLMQIKSLLADGTARSSRAVAARMGGTASPFMVERLLRQADRFDEATLRHYLTNLRWADLNLKSTALPARGVLETAVVASTVGKTLAPAFD